MSNLHNNVYSHMQVFNNLKILLILSLLDNFMAPISEIIFGGGDNPSKVFSPFVSMVVTMNTCFMSTTSFLDQVYFHNTTFKLGLLMSFEKLPTLLDDKI